MRTRFISSPSDPASSDAGDSRVARATGHTTVLLRESILQLAIRTSDVIVDATLGGAGHAKLIAEQLGTEGMLIGFDLDADALTRARKALAHASCRCELIGANFRDIRQELSARGVERVDKALFDLGWSGFQLSAGRGFSFLSDEPLLMTYVRDITPATLTAHQIVNEWAESSLADVIFGFGEERFAKRIARAIVARRARKPIENAHDLAEVIRSAVPAAYARGKLHPATKTFQAVRIAVNDELGALEEGIGAAWRLLSKGGRIAVITFHSIEDRIVKQTFVAWEKAGEGKRITKKPIIPSREELKENPRARSAKLRVIEKL